METLCHLKSLRGKFAGDTSSDSPAPKFIFTLSLPFSIWTIQKSVVPATKRIKAFGSNVRNLNCISVVLLASLNGI